MVQEKNGGIVMNPVIYLDNAANTPVLPEVLSTYQNITLSYTANPNASHPLGQKANQKLREATHTIASILHAKPTEIIYASGATEANNLAIKGVAYANRGYGKHIITSYLEHSSVIGSLMALQEEGYEVDFVDINRDGTINLNHFQELLRKDTILVSIAAIDSEVGCRQDLAQLYLLIKQLPHCAFHTDATQAIGKFEVDYEQYDLMTCTPHKFHGLNGFGLLVCKENIILHPQIHGGLSTTPYRSGTPVLAMVCALETALVHAYKNNEIHKALNHVEQQNKQLQQTLASYSNVVIHSPSNSSPYILNLSLKKMKAEQFQEALSAKNIFVSTKAACCAVNTPSKPVYAITKDRKLAMSTLRISLSKMTTATEINLFLQAFDEVYHQLGE